MNKADLVTVLRDKHDIKMIDARNYVETIFDAISDSLADGEEVSIAGFGKFVVNQRDERTGFNPQTKEKIVIPAKKVPAFKAEKKLKEIVNTH